MDEQSVPEGLEGRRAWRAVTFFLVGLAFLVTAGRLIVAGAKDIAIGFGTDEFIFGATIPRRAG